MNHVIGQVKPARESMFPLLCVLDGGGQRDGGPL